MILAAAQTKPKRGNIEENLMDHYRLIELASDQGADLIVFPELSITGYELVTADSLSFSQNDSRLDHLKELAVEKKIIIIVGAPLKINSNLFIGGFTFRPDDSVSLYTKQFLYPGEEEYYSSSFDYNPIFELDQEKVSMAICADIMNRQHPENAKKVGSTLYVSSIFFSPEGIAGGHRLLSKYAKKHAMNVLMANYCGESCGRPAGGRSAFWDKDGELVAELEGSNPGLLIVEKMNIGWTGQIIIY